MDNICFEVKVSEMYFPMIWRSKFTDLINNEKTQSLGKNSCRQKCLDKSLLSCMQIYKIMLGLADKFSELRHKVKKSRFLYEEIATTFLNDLSQYKQQFNTLKGYLRYKTILCHKAALDV